MSVAFTCFRLSSREFRIKSLRQVACLHCSPTLGILPNKHTLRVPVRDWSSATDSTSTSEGKNIIIIKGYITLDKDANKFVSIIAH